MAAHSLNSTCDVMAITGKLIGWFMCTAPDFVDTEQSRVVIVSVLASLLWHPDIAILTIRR
jgi:hypothetical protein